MQTSLHLDLISDEGPLQKKLKMPNSVTTGKISNLFRTTMGCLYW